MAGGGRRIGRHLALRGAFAAVVLWSAGSAGTAAASSQQCGRAGTPYPLPCDVVAVVGDQPITRAEYEHWYRIAVRSGGDRVAPDPPQFTKCVAAKRRTARRGRRDLGHRRLERRCAAEHRALRDQVMQLLISFRWIRGEAAARGLTVTPAELRAQFREQKRVSFPKQEDYEKFLRDTRQSEADILLRVELDILSSKIREGITRDGSAVGDREIRRYYRRNRERFAMPERRNLLIVLSRTRREAAAARARIEAGERWAGVAEDLSIDEASRSRGGRLRLVADGQQGRALNRAFFAAERGELRGPVRARSGWYVFKVTGIEPARRQSLAQARRTIAALLRARREQEVLDSFVRDFTRRWRSRTICRQGYRTPDCANGPSG